MSNRLFLQDIYTHIIKNTASKTKIKFKLSFTLKKNNKYLYF